MGDCHSDSHSKDIQASLRNKEIALDRQIEDDAKTDKEKIKLLLLGTGESGKSTIFKQMKLIYGSDYNEEEKIQFRSLIHHNIIETIKILVDNAIDKNIVGINEFKSRFDIIRDLDPNAVINTEIGDVIKSLWVDPGIQTVWSRRCEFQVNESTQYFLDKIDEIKLGSFLPNKSDILYVRVRTTSIVVERYNIGGNSFEIYDVGGQRNERKKWIHCFEGVTAVLFIVDMSEYDLKLLEDGSTNRMASVI
jgi:GTPase SAR1 family protein